MQVAPAAGDGNIAGSPVNALPMIIYGSIGSRASRVLWTAEELDLRYEWNPISTLTGANRSPEYLAVNPSGKIPALKDGDLVMTESLAINLYLTQQHGAGSLWPATPADQARVLQWSMWSATEIESHVTALFLQLIVRKPEQRDHALVERQLGELMPKFHALEDGLAGGDYLLGRFTLADIQVAVQTLALCKRLKLDFSAYPRVLAWTERCAQRPARRQVDAWAAAAQAQAAAAKAA